MNLCLVLTRRLEIKTNSNNYNNKNALSLQPNVTISWPAPHYDG